MGILSRELSVLYRAFSRAEPSPLDDLPMQYADYAYSQQEWVGRGGHQTELDYWRTTLSAPPPPLKLTPVSFLPKAHGTPELSFRSAEASIAIPDCLYRKLRRLSRDEGCTLFMTLLCAFKAFLHQRSGETDICVAVLTANRSAGETKDLIGPFLNTVILRTYVSGDVTFRSSLRRLRRTAIEAYAHQDVPFDLLLSALEQQPDFDGESFCRVMCLLEDDFTDALALEGLRTTSLNLDQLRADKDLTLTTFDLILIWKTRGEALEARIIYKSDLFDASFIEGSLRWLLQLLDCVTSQPDRLLSTIGMAAPTAKLTPSSTCP
jgi:non-ribosomal peptide synthetase component F